MEITWKWLMFPVFAALLAEVQVPPHEDICGPLNSPMPVPTSFDAFSVEEVKWKINSSQGEKLIGTFKDGKETAGWNDKYKALENGTKLVIKNLTENNTGIYTAEATFMFGVLRSKNLNVTVCGKKRNKISLIASVIVVSVLSVFLMCKYWKRSSDTSGQDDQNNEASVIVPIQETGFQESSFIEILHEKSEYKDQEDEGFKVRNKPSGDHNSVY